MSTIIGPTESAACLTSDDLHALVSSKGRPEETLTSVVNTIQRRLGVDVCSIYLVAPDRATIVLAATVGLRAGSIGHVRMRLDEGLAGLVAEQMRPVMVDEAPKHPRFKFFPEAGEAQYHSFLGVPLVDGRIIQGVLVVQTSEPRAFSREEMSCMTATAVQIGPLVGAVRTLSQFVAPTYDRVWELARNLWWSWDADATALFRDLDPVRWRELNHNPIALLSEISLDEMEQRAGRHVLHSRIHYAHRRLQEYLAASNTWGGTHAGVLRARPVAYFSAEFGLHESLPIYSGGLGVLAGDHLKSASDLGVPLVGVGLLYDQGYFHQKLDLSGWQIEDYIDVDVSKLAIEPALGADHRPVAVHLHTRTGPIAARVWKLNVGRNILLLLDSDVEGNAPEDRELTARLYGGDQRVRIRQELLLGVGGVQALRLMGIVPGVVHLNEGHSAFAPLEMARWRMDRENVSFDDAMRRVRRQTVFTTHTPVPAGHDRFSPELVEEHLGPLRDALRLTYEQLLGYGRVQPDDPGETFCMTVLALKASRRANAVSSLHGEVSRAMWTPLWPDRSEDEIPIGHITNGVHVHTWLAPQMRQLYDRHLAGDWSLHSGEPQTWDAIERISDGELWETHQVLKSRMLNFVRARAARQARARGEPVDEVERWSKSLTLDTLTIGFARRFATYKRADMIFHNTDLLAELVNDPQRPVQFVFAGKAHPQDSPGKAVLRRISDIMRSPDFAGRVMFVEDYDMNVARHLVQGVDVWLNNPRRPLEASGTSGQKVVLNGVLNLSVLDGWWAEAYTGANGFAIGAGDTNASLELHDQRDGESLYQTMRGEVVPLFYNRDHDGLPRGWIARMKSAIRTLGWRFNADRMVMDYVLNSYIPAAGGRSCDMG